MSERVLVVLQKRGKLPPGQACEVVALGLQGAACEARSPSFEVPIRFSEERQSFEVAPEAFTSFQRQEAEQALLERVVWQ